MLSSLPLGVQLVEDVKHVVVELLDNHLQKSTLARVVFAVFITVFIADSTFLSHKHPKLAANLPINNPQIRNRLTNLKNLTTDCADFRLRMMVI